MDEVFHGPQAREYCRGNFTAWHPKITTFPGLYYLGTLYGWGRRAAYSLVGTAAQDAACSTPSLRSLNVVLSGACLLVLRAILTTRYGRRATSHAPAAPSSRFIQDQQPQDEQQQPQQSLAELQQRPARDGARRDSPSGAAEPHLGPLHSSFHDLALALYPLHWFFSFLYYTDVASLLFLLMCHLQATRRRYWLAALAGGVAVLCRQTNAVWAGFVLGEAALAEIGMDRAPESGPAAASVVAPVARMRREDAQLAAGGGVLGELRVAAARAWRARRRLAAALWPLLLPLAGFAAFLVANRGSVVLGDKEAHAPVRHGAQLLYFGAWAALMLWPLLLPEVARLSRAAGRWPLTAALVAAGGVAAAAGVAHVSTLAHPYLLADNRHYVFYLWRRVFARTPTAKYALAPAYAAAWALLLSALLRRVSRLWLLGFLACLTVTLLPAWLLELRYFTPGVYLIALRLGPPNYLQTGAMLHMYSVINLLTMYFFLLRPYIWDDGSVARFLW